ncbi:hypothetical protein Y1Q_0019994 [Alligator mississippiensis]|uniref:Uncharacterized protein n=1 Tax=Alligator mississippiensis TaxID=8496 RepID=A0A151PDU9_ALLMI|nr:hypothetical protein Y1Q_0019994 [Alligator mississippiensis]
MLKSFLLLWVDGFLLCASVILLHSLGVHLWRWLLAEREGKGAKKQEVKWAQSSRRLSVCQLVCDNPACHISTPTALAPMPALLPATSEQGQPSGPLPGAVLMRPCGRVAGSGGATALQELQLQPRVRAVLQSAMAKKGMEIHLETFPALARGSWRRLQHLSQLPLPKLIQAGDSALQPRSRHLPFVPSDSLDRVDLAVQRQRLGSLLGLLALHLESITPRAIQASSGPDVLGRSPIESLQTGAPFLRPYALEVHVGTKKQPCAWGWPELMEKSLGAFVLGSPRMMWTPARHRAELQVYVGGTGPPPISSETRSCPEHHISRGYSTSPSHHYTHLHVHIQGPGAPPISLETRSGLESRVSS